jgi:hypothetical protein
VGGAGVRELAAILLWMKRAAKIFILLRFYGGSTIPCRSPVNRGLALQPTFSLQFFRHLQLLIIFDRASTFLPRTTNPTTASASKHTLPITSTCGHVEMVKYGVAIQANVAPKAADNP